MVTAQPSMTEPAPRQYATLAAALAAFQAELPSIRKGAKADTGAYTYAYAPLEDVVDVVLKGLGKVGLSVTSALIPSGLEHPPMWYRTTLHHTTDEDAIHSDWPILLASPQVMGSAMSYGRRYCILGLSGVAPGGEDDDGKQATDAHNKLARETVAAPKRATRSKTAKGDDEWTDPPPMQLLNVTPAVVTDKHPNIDIREMEPSTRDPGKRTESQSTAIFALLGALGLAHDRDQSLALMSALVGRKLASSKELTRGDAQHVINSLQALGDSPDAAGAIRTLIDSGML